MKGYKHKKHLVVIKAIDTMYSVDCYYDGKHINSLLFTDAASALKALTKHINKIKNR